MITNHYLNQYLEYWYAPNLTNEYPDTFDKPKILRTKTKIYFDSGKVTIGTVLKGWKTYNFFFVSIPNVI